MTIEPGVAVTVADGVRRLTAPNPSMMTGPGTNTWLIEGAQSLVIDPGPPLLRHIDAICDAVGHVDAILVTHTHPDHSPGATLLAERTGAELLGRPPPAGRHQDQTFRPDRVLEEGDRVAELTVLHTPGHASNHLCFLREADGLLFTGDHIINGSTVVIDPPDGDMADYLAQLERLKTVGVQRIAPGHGEVFEEPLAVIDWIIAHRLERERKVFTVLADNPGKTSMELTQLAYTDVDTRLHPVAERSLLAHLYKLQDDGRALLDGDRWRAA